MKKNVILSLVFITLILLIGSCACSCEHNYMEGFTQTVGPPITYSIPLTQNTIASISVGEKLEEDTVLIESGTDKTLATSDYCAILETNSSATAKGLMILKKTSPGNLAVSASVDGATTAVDSAWKVIWASSISDAHWVGSPLTLTSTALTIATSVTGNNKIAGFTVPSNLLDADLLELTLVDGDLLIKKGTKVLWSLFDSELSSAKSEVENYMKSNETVRSTMNGRDELKIKLQNLNTYFAGIQNKLNIGSDAVNNAANYQKMVDIRHKMDFELSEINGASGTKLNLSQTTLQSTMYVNLAISVLAASLFVLLYSR